MTTQIAYPHTVRDIVNEYKQKSEDLKAEIEYFKKAECQINNAVQVIGGVTNESIIARSYPSESTGQRILLSSAWQAIYMRLGLDNVFSAADKKKFQQSLTSPAPLTLENLQATFGKYWENPRYYILKGLAEAFCSLDKFYKSHSNFGFGVEKIPKRAILSNFGGYGTWGSDRLKDIAEAMLQVSGESKLTQDELNAIQKYRLRIEDFELPRLGFSIKMFKNGNAHVHFNKRALQLVNDALHEFYGEVLPDAQDKGERTKSTEVSKDLQFYRTPKSVVDRVMESVYLNKGSLVLEPSCGDGALLDGLRAAGYRCAGIEYHPGRANEARSKGHSVLTANFLDTAPDPIYDAVVMNPPFYGKHYLKHIEHALRFIKVGGLLVSILPASAWYEHKLIKGRWHDLPIGSFKESGTNVNTGFLIIRA